MYIPGDRFGICDRCGFKFRMSQLRKEHTGLMVCAKDFDHRHPQEMVRPIAEKSHVIDSRPEKADRFI